MATSARLELEAGGRTVVLTHPERVVFAEGPITKADLARYYCSVGDHLLGHVRDRPATLKRFPHGAAGPFFFNQEAPSARPEWVSVAEVAFPSGRHGLAWCPRELAEVIWAVNLGCIDLNPWAVRRSDLLHPDELRIDLDPAPGLSFAAVREAALAAGDLLGELGLASCPKTSGGRGMHVLVPIEPLHSFVEVRRAAVALARELERRHPDLVTTSWWRQDRGARVLFDYNQNGPDRTLAAAFSVRPNPAAQVSFPLRWDEVASADPAAYTLATVGRLLTERGDASGGLDELRRPLAPLLELARRDEAAGLADAPWPPMFPKAPDEPPRVPPARRATDGTPEEG